MTLEDFGTWEELCKRFLQINHCIFCKNNTSETHWQSKVCNHCLEDAIEQIKEGAK